MGKESAFNDNFRTYLCDLLLCLHLLYVHVLCVCLWKCASTELLMKVLDVLEFWIRGWTLKTQNLSALQSTHFLELLIDNCVDCCCDFNGITSSNYYCSMCHNHLLRFTLPLLLLLARSTFLHYFLTWQCDFGDFLHCSLDIPLDWNESWCLKRSWNRSIYPLMDHLVINAFPYIM